MRDTVYLYVFDGMADWEPSFALAELASGRFFRPGAPRLRIKTCAVDSGPIVTMGGLRLLPDCALSELEAESACALILPGGDSWLAPQHAPILEVAAEWLKRGIVVAAICGATFALAQAGLLDAHPHTSNDLGFLRQICPTYEGAEYYRALPAVRDGALITASGVAPLEFACELFRALDVFSEATLAAWLALYKTQEPAHFAALMASLAR